jgi:hypothetical protein
MAKTGNLYFWQQPRKSLAPFCSPFPRLGAQSRKIQQDPQEKLFADEKYAIPTPKIMPFSGFSFI